MRWDELPASQRDRLRAGRDRNRALRKMEAARRRQERATLGPRRTYAALSKVPRRSRDALRWLVRAQYALGVVQGRRPEVRSMRRALCDLVDRECTRVRAELVAAMEKYPSHAGELRAILGRA